MTENTTDLLIENLKKRSYELSNQIKENDYQREYYNAKGRHLRSQLALTERHLEELGFSQQPLPLAETAAEIKQNNPEFFSED